GSRLHLPFQGGTVMISRRSLLVSAAAMAAVRPATGSAQTAQASASRESATPVTTLRLQRRTIEVNGKAASVFAIRQPDGTSGITTEVGKPFRVHLENNIDQPSLIHWHGLTPAVTPRRRARHSSAADPARRQRRLRFPSALWRHVLDALPSRTAGAIADAGAAHHPRRP